MTLFLSNFPGKNQSVEHTSQLPTNGSATDAAVSQKVVEAIRNMLPGQTISGEVIETNGKEIQLLLDNNVVLKARLEQSMNLALGQILNFEVKSNKDAQLAIRPLFTNVAMDETLFKALDEAGLVPNEKNLQMAKAMMEEGLSVDKKSLQFMYRQILSNTEVAATHLAQMSRLQIPFSPENLKQFEAYKNYEHQLMEGVKSVAEKLPQAVLDLISEGKGAQAEILLRNIVGIFAGEEEGFEELKIPASGKMAGQDLILPKEETLLAKENLLTKETLLEREVSLANSVLEGADGKVKTGVIPLPQDAIGHVFDVSQREQIFQLLKEAMQNGELTLAPEKLQQVLNGELSSKELLQMLLPMTQADLLEKVEWKDFFSSEVFSKLLKEEVTKQWSIAPNDIPKEKSIEALYERIREQTGRLMDTLAATMKPDATIMKDVSLMRDNVDFMNQMNQIFTYVQLPLKMSNQQAHGELYVYTNKKNLAKKDGNVTALLHLDMEHLGSLDIFVSMQEEKVSTKFYLEREELLDFMEKHMHLLNERLAKRGYSMQSEVLAKETKTNVMEEILKQDKSNITIAEQAFDMRA